MLLYHFTDREGLSGIMESGYIRANSNSKNYESARYVSLTSDADLSQRSNDVRYANRDVMIVIEVAENDVTEVVYDKAFFLAHLDIASYVFTDMDDFETLLNGEDVDSLEYALDMLREEREFVCNRDISINEIFDVEFVYDDVYK